jgi:hypothetical protein
MAVAAGAAIAAGGSDLMAVPVLFVEGMQADDLFNCLRRQEWAAEWQDVGLADYFGDVKDADACAVNDAKTGPGGVAGCVASVWPEDAEPPAVLGYFPQQQKWIPAAPGVWVACADVPRPQDLERHYIAAKSTEPVVFANGSIWEVPLLREPVGRTEQMVLPELHHPGLPQSIRKDPLTGGWQSRVLPEYAELFELSRKWFEFFLVRESAEVRWSDLFDYCVRVMSLNYRYGHLMHSAFDGQWITTENIWDVARVSCGYELVCRHSMEKKKMIRNS